jgi:hypothetical protein
LSFELLLPLHEPATCRRLSSSPPRRASALTAPIAATAIRVGRVSVLSM